MEYYIKLILPPNVYEPIKWNSVKGFLFTVVRFSIPNAIEDCFEAITFMQYHVVSILILSVFEEVI